VRKGPDNTGVYYLQRCGEGPWGRGWLARSRTHATVEQTAHRKRTAEMMRRTVLVPLDMAGSACVDVSVCHCVTLGTAALCHCGTVALCYYVTVSLGYCRK